ncbi:MAG: T9SS type A sorting domain-containing protein, partial [Bacteroidia bacterium]|nr:T9SS type A sorting domain-containing protein [Bacteroidia bacterium]
DTVKFTGFPTSIAVDDTFYFQLKLKVNKSASNPNDHNTIIIPSQLYASASAPGSCKIVTDNNTNITFLPVPKITLYTDKQKTLWWKVHTDTYARVILEYLDEVSKQFKHSQFDYPYTQDPRQQVVSNHKYWRAKLVTKDGLWTYSNVVELTNMDAPAMPVFEVYPNPATNVLNVDLLYGKVKYTRLEVYDVFGRLIFWHVTHITGAGEKAQIDISGLNSGMYLVKISTDVETHTYRVVKQ